MDWHRLELSAKQLAAGELESLRERAAWALFSCVKSQAGLFVRHVPGSGGQEPSAELFVTPNAVEPLRSLFRQYAGHACAPPAAGGLELIAGTRDAWQLLESPPAGSGPTAKPT